MPGGQAIRLGPFIGGINSLSDASAIADVELVECKNFELDVDGSLICRPPITEILDNSSFTERILLLGISLLNGSVSIIGSNSDGVYKWVSNSWSLITDTFTATCMVQYMDKIWLIADPSSTNPGGNWDGTTFTAVSAMPKGNSAVIHKERLFVVPGSNASINSSRLIFSNPGNFSTWTSTDFIDISPGDGQELIDITVYQDNLLLFKQDSTYVLAYDTKPAEAVVRQISTTLGTTKAHCVVNYENSVFVYHQGEIYEIVNYDFNRINTKVPFLFDPTSPGGAAFKEDIFLSVFGDRLLVRYFNRIYVYGLRTRTWTRWESANDKLHYFGPIVSFPSDISNTINDQYFAGSCVVTSKNLIRIDNGFDSLTVEQDLSNTTNITCSITTKNYDLAVSHKFKKLFWWGADVLTGNTVTGIVNPVVAQFKTTWDQMSSKTWDELNTWDFPLVDLSSISTPVTSGTNVLRKFVKFPKTLRFRQINFTVSLTSAGSTVDGPARLYSITIIAETRATVTQGSN